MSPLKRSYEELERVFSDAWFKLLSPAMRSTLLREGRLVTVHARDFVVRKGDPPNGFYGVVDGVLTASSVLRDGRQMIFGLLEAGDWFGEASSIDGLARPHDIGVLRDAELIHIPLQTFEQLMRDAVFARAIAVLQAARARTVYAFFEDATLQSTRVRIARRLLKLIQGDAPTMPRPRKVVPVTHETLSMMLGLTRQTLSLELKALAATGAVSLSYGRIVVESDVLLQALSENPDTL